MKWVEQLNENIKRTLRSWLNVLPANPYNFQINEMLDFEAWNYNGLCPEPGLEHSFYA